MIVWSGMRIIQTNWWDIEIPICNGSNREEKHKYDQFGTNLVTAAEIETTKHLTKNSRTTGPFKLALSMAKEKCSSISLEYTAHPKWYKDYLKYKWMNCQCLCYLA